jgi:hypothetical protein
MNGTFGAIASDYTALIQPANGNTGKAVQGRSTGKKYVISVPGSQSSRSDLIGGSSSFQTDLRFN